MLAYILSSRYNLLSGKELLIVQNYKGITTKYVGPVLTLCGRLPSYTLHSAILTLTLTFNLFS